MTQESGGPQGVAPAPSAFVEKAQTPTADALAAALGPTLARWTALLARLTAEVGPLRESWSYSGRRLGWSLRAAVGSRPLLYLTPLVGGFRASLALPEAAWSTALDAGEWSEHLRAVLAEAPRYPEGRAVRLEVASDDDIAAVLALARLRMARSVRRVGGDSTTADRPA